MAILMGGSFLLLPYLLLFIVCSNNRLFFRWFSLLVIYIFTRLMLSLTMANYCSYCIFLSTDKEAILLILSFRLNISDRITWLLFFNLMHFYLIFFKYYSSNYWVTSFFEHYSILLAISKCCASRNYKSFIISGLNFVYTSYRVPLISL